MDGPARRRLQKIYFAASISAYRRVITASRTKQPADKQEEVMKHIRTFSIWALGILAAGAIWLGLAGTVAQASDKGDTNAAAAFAQLKTLAGTWEAATKQGKATTTYEVISNGSALVEHLDMPNEGAMVTVYHLDGDRLVLTHYCTAGNQ